MSFDRDLDKEDVVYIYIYICIYIHNGILLSSKMDGPRDYHTK